MYIRKHRKPARKSSFFDPMVYILDRIKAHFDGKAYLTHNEKGLRVIKYRQETGKRLVLGSRNNARLVYDNFDHELTEEQAVAICKELGQV